MPKQDCTDPISFATRKSYTERASQNFYKFSNKKSVVQHLEVATTENVDQCKI